MTISKVQSERFQSAPLPDDSGPGVRRTESAGARIDAPSGLKARPSEPESPASESSSQRRLAQLPPLSPPRDDETASMLGSKVGRVDSASFIDSPGSSGYKAMQEQARTSEPLLSWRDGVENMGKDWAKDRLKGQAQAGTSQARPESSTAGRTFTHALTFKDLPDVPIQAPQTQQTQPPAADEIRGRQPPERSWRSVGQAILRELSLTAGSVRPQVDVAAAGRTLGVVAGHAIHQAVAVGVPTFAREMLAAGVMHALRSSPPPVAMGLQMAMGAANLGMQVIREVRERRNPAEAARAYHSLSPEQWAAKRPAEQDRMIKHTQKVSRAITVGQVASSITNLALMASAFQEGHRADALRPLATEVKVGLYTNMRDAIQASFSMVGYDGDKMHGLSGQAFAAAAATYAGVNAGASMLSDGMMATLVPGRGQAIDTLLGIAPAPGGNPMSGAQAWGTVAQAAAVSALGNTIGETIDWIQRTHQHLSQNEVPPQQEWRPQLTGDDLGRVLDQAQARTALLNGINATLTAAGRAMTDIGVPPAIQSFVGNAGLAALTALTDSPITGIWQAEQAVRKPPEAESDVESGHVSGSGSGGRTGNSSFRVADVPSRQPPRTPSASGSERGSPLPPRDARSARFERVPFSHELQLAQPSQSSPPTVVDVEPWHPAVPPSGSAAGTSKAARPE
jgi:hypothetical protein